MSVEPNPADNLRASDADREAVATRLNNAMAEGRLNIDELQERLDVVYAAKTRAELVPVVSDLPLVASGNAPAASPRRLVGAGDGPGVSIGIFSGSDRSGHWSLPENHTAFAAFGGVELDLREATLEAANCTITCVALFGGIEITVPEDVQVQVSGLPLFGGFSSRNQGKVNAAPAGAPRLKIRGLAMFGGVEVKRVPRDSPQITD
ncbi:MAG: DUF1707 domain-containing protein [Antricoccus sp.]